MSNSLDLTQNWKILVLISKSTSQKQPNTKIQTQKLQLSENNRTKEKEKQQSQRPKIGKKKSARSWKENKLKNRVDTRNYLKIKGSYHFLFLRKRESRSILQQRSYIGEVAIPPSHTHSFSNFCRVSSHYPPFRTHSFS